MCQGLVDPNYTGPSWDCRLDIPFCFPILKACNFLENKHHKNEFILDINQKIVSILSTFTLLVPVSHRAPVSERAELNFLIPCVISLITSSFPLSVPPSHYKALSSSASSDGYTKQGHKTPAQSQWQDTARSWRDMGEGIVEGMRETDGKQCKLQNGDEGDMKRKKKRRIKIRVKAYQTWDSSDRDTGKTEKSGYFSPNANMQQMVCSQSMKYITAHKQHWATQQP